MASTWVGIGTSFPLLWPLPLPDGRPRYRLYKGAWDPIALGSSPLRKEAESPNTGSKNLET